MYSLSFQAEASDRAERHPTPPSDEHGQERQPTPPHGEGRPTPSHLHDQQITPPRQSIPPNKPTPNSTSPPPGPECPTPLGDLDGPNMQAECVSRPPAPGTSDNPSEQVDRTVDPDVRNQFWTTMALYGVEPCYSRYLTVDGFT